MQLSAPDFRYRAQLTELMDEPCSRDVLRAWLRDIARTNQWTFAYRPLVHWAQRDHRVAAGSQRTAAHSGCGLRLRVFAKLARLHHFVQYDGPVSIARSFVAADWSRMCAAAGLNSAPIEIQAFKPARLCVSRRKTQ
jgi:hypothetical protein